MRDFSMKLLAVGLSVLLSLSVLSYFVGATQKPSIYNLDAFNYSSKDCNEVGGFNIDERNYQTELTAVPVDYEAVRYHSGLIESYILSTSAIPHGPIYIDGDSDFRMQAQAEGWSGDGSKKLPYIIENYLIDLNGADGYCIEVCNVKSTYFIIRNCIIQGATGPYAILEWPYTGARSGIHLYKTHNAVVEDNTCTNNLVGIWLNQSEDCAVTRNTCFGNLWDGIDLVVWSDNNLVSENHCFENIYDGILVWSGCEKNTLSDNICEFNGRGGISLTGWSEWLGGANKNNIDSNTCTGNGAWGIALRGVCERNTVIGNDCRENYDSILLAISDKNQIIGNTIIDNFWGIRILESHSCEIIDNTCSDNQRSGIYLSRSESNTIENNLCSSNEWDGISVIDGSSSNKIIINECTSNDYDGIFIGYGELGCNKNLVRGNDCIENGYAGIHVGYPYSTLQDSADNQLIDNVCDDNYYGILLESYSITTTVDQNSCSGNIQCGFMLYDSSDNTIRNNIATNNYYNYRLDFSDFNYLFGNTGSGERDDVYFNVVVGIQLIASQENLIEGNEISVTHYGISLDYSDNNLLKDNTVTGTWHGYALTTSSWNSIEANIADDIDDMGFWLCQDSNHNELYSNTATDCTHGFRLGFTYITDWTNHIVFHEPVEENVLMGNTATDCSWTGFLVDNSNGNILEGNTAVDNLAGFRLEWGSADNLIIDNVITSTTGRDAGIRIWGSNNVVTENTISGDHWWGIAMDYDLQWGITSMGNLIYHNNLIDNLHQAIDWYPENNYWYHPDLLEGNYWSDYLGLDDGSNGRVPYDGIGDTNLPWHYDWYPLMTPFP
ncbi:MAG: nitrous oxide reductase family maturation protein NosD [Candidatus Thorarchaeota archaeon]